MKDYIKRIRSKIGNEKIIHPAARIIIENERGEILVIERADNGKIGIPAGAFEENETIQECIVREVKEETGIDVIDLEVIGISSSPSLEMTEYENGDKIQYFTVEFYSNKWQGEINVGDRNEVKAARFVEIDRIARLPKNETSAIESLNYYRKNKKIMLK